MIASSNRSGAGQVSSNTVRLGSKRMEQSPCMHSAQLRRKEGNGQSQQRQETIKWRTRGRINFRRSCGKQRKGKVRLEGLGLIRSKF